MQDYMSDKAILLFSQLYGNGLYRIFFSLAHQEQQNDNLD